MKTPVYDFVRRYAEAGGLRFHVPGHRGRGPLGVEALDLTEIAGADSLFEAEGIIAEGERNTAALYGSQKTIWSAEGSSQCIRTMLYLAAESRFAGNRPAGTLPLILAARNVHKSFVFGAALLGLDVEWLWPEAESGLCGCPITPAGLQRALEKLPAPPAAVYVTSPDYLGGMQDIRGLAETAHRFGALLLVDNAHGAYLHFLEEPLHPLDLGADLCCDSAHKTLPVLTGGAYLHLGKNAPAALGADMKTALALFGSTSPSYLILASLDLCNEYLEREMRPALAGVIGETTRLKNDLKALGYALPGAEPLKLTVDGRPLGYTGTALAEGVRAFGIEPEYADPEALVLMNSPRTTPEETARLREALTKLAENCGPALQEPPLPPAKGEKVMTIREALLRPHEIVPARESLGRVCHAPTVACPPAVPIAVSGELIGPEALALFSRCGVETVDVVKE